MRRGENRAARCYLGAPLERCVCLPNTRFLIHQPSGSAGGPASDIAIRAREIAKARERIARTIARQTGKTGEQLQVDFKHDCWMSAEEVVDYDLMSRIVQRKPELDST